MKDTARVILTTKCPRRCSYCVNEYPGVLESARQFRFMHDMVRMAERYQVVCLTGGEPMIAMPEHATAMAFVLKHSYPNMKVYLYVSAYHSWDDMAEILKVIDGVHYTLHASGGMEDLGKFYLFQDMARGYPGKSHRLYIHPHFLQDVTLVHGVWSRVELKPWLGPEDCCLPDNEDLYIWRDQ